MQENNDGGKVIIHSNAHKLLFGGEIDDEPINKKAAPLNSKSKEVKKVSKAPKLQKPAIQRNQNVGYGQRYSQKKTFESPLKTDEYSPAPLKPKNSDPTDELLFQANPLPDFHEEIKSVNQFIPPQYKQYQGEQPNLSNYAYHNQQVKSGNGSSTPHDQKRADFERNRRSHITNVSQNIVSSRDGPASQAMGMNNGSYFPSSESNISASDTRISHSMNTNKGYVKMKTGGNNSGLNANEDIKEVKKSKGGKNLILNQYSQNLPPHQIDYQSGFQQIPSPKYNLSEETIARRAQAQPILNQPMYMANGVDNSYYTSEVAPPIPTQDIDAFSPAYIPQSNINVINVPSKPPKPNSRQNDKKGGYKPYSLKEFKEKHQDPAMFKMGGLGANIGTEEWEMRNNKLKAMKDFASRVKVENRAKSMNPPARNRREQAQEKSSRQKALEFAKNIPKPTVAEKKAKKLTKYKSTNDYDCEDEMMLGLDEPPEEPVFTEFDQLNQKHEQYVNEVNDIRRMFM